MLGFGSIIFQGGVKPLAGEGAQRRHATGVPTIQRQPAALLL